MAAILKRILRVALFASAFGFISACSASTSYGVTDFPDGPTPCGKGVDAHLQRIGQAPETVQGVRYFTWYSMGKDDYVKRVDAYVTLKDNPGYLVVQMNRFCQVTNVYQRGGD